MTTKVGRGKRVLDVATGPGYAAAASARRGAEVVGVDVAHQMVALSRKLHPGIEFRQGDAEHLPFDHGSFDAVIGNFAILHFARPERAVAGFARLLAPGGMLALSTWDAPSRMRLIGVLLDAIEQAGATPSAAIPPGPSFFRFADEAEFSRLLAGAGLDEVRVRTISATHRLSGAGELWDVIVKGTVRSRAMLLGQPRKARARIRAALDQLVGEYASGGGLELPVSIKLAAGRKPRG
jgi:ubiquinone/menaquinone biosynthesis C-methylase UbiE